MISDALVNFVPIGSALAILGAAVPSNVYDVTGAGVGQAPPNIIGNAALFGSDLGIGGKKPQLEVLTGVAFATANAATLNIQMQAAPDTGAAGGYLPGTWQTLVETGALTAAQLAAATVCGRFDWPPAFPATLRPRFYRLNFLPLAATAFTAGTISAAIVTMVRDDQANKYATRNYNV